MFIKMAEVSALTGSPIDPIIDAINEALFDINYKHDKADDAFDHRTN